jgi:hypothetical protein
MVSELDITLGGLVFMEIQIGLKIGLKIGIKCKKWILNKGENPVISMVRLAGIEPAHPVPETGALSPEL